MEQSGSQALNSEASRCGRHHRDMSRSLMMFLAYPKELRMKFWMTFGEGTSLEKFYADLGSTMVEAWATSENNYMHIYIYVLHVYYIYNI